MSESFGTEGLQSLAKRIQRCPRCNGQVIRCGGDVSSDGRQCLACGWEPPVEMPRRTQPTSVSRWEQRKK